MTYDNFKPCFALYGNNNNILNTYKSTASGIKIDVSKGSVPGPGALLSKHTFGQKFTLEFKFKFIQESVYVPHNPLGEISDIVPGGLTYPDSGLYLGVVAKADDVNTKWFDTSKSQVINMLCGAPDFLGQNINPDDASDTVYAVLPTDPFDRSTWYDEIHVKLESSVQNDNQAIQTFLYQGDTWKPVNYSGYDTNPGYMTLPDSPTVAAFGFQIEGTSFEVRDINVIIR